MAGRCVGMKLVNFSVTPQNTNKYLLAMCVCLNVKLVCAIRFKTHTQHSAAHIRYARTQSKKASGEWATSECFPFEPCYSYRLRIAGQKWMENCSLDANNKSICMTLHENAVNEIPKTNGSSNSNSSSVKSE